MVMFNGINNALDDNAPRKTDVLLNPTPQADAQGSQAPQGQPASGQVQPTQNTAITPSDSSSKSSSPQQTPQAARSPQAVLDANSNVQIDNTAANTAANNAKNIAAQQVAAGSTYAPQATTNFQADQDYVKFGGTAPAAQDYASNTANALPTYDKSQVTNAQNDFTSNPYSGITNALDKALALRSDNYRQQGIAATQGIQQAAGTVDTAQAASQAKYDAGLTASQADDAQINPWANGQLTQAQKDYQIAADAANARAGGSYQDAVAQDQQKVASAIQAAIAAHQGNTAGLTPQNVQAGLLALQPNNSSTQNGFFNVGRASNVTADQQITQPDADRLNRLATLAGTNPSYAAYAGPAATGVSNTYNDQAVQDAINNYFKQNAATQAAQQAALAKNPNATSQPVLAPTDTGSIAAQAKATTNLPKPIQQAVDISKALGTVLNPVTQFKKLGGLF